MTVSLSVEQAQKSKNGYDARYLRDVVDAVVKAKRVLCLTGAGISTSAGIPVSTANLYIVSCLLIGLRDKRTFGQRMGCMSWLPAGVAAVPVQVTTRRLLPHLLHRPLRAVASYLGRTCSQRPSGKLPNRHNVSFASFLPYTMYPKLHNLLLRIPS